MKRVICVLVAVAAVLFIAGCSFEKTYFVAAGTGTNSYCMEVVTSSSNIENVLTLAGYKEGTCAANGYGSAHYCSITAGTGADSYTINEYWGSSIDASIIQSACTGTYH